MALDAPHRCDSMARALDEDDTSISYGDRFREYLLLIHDGGTSGVLMRFCPFCGAELPESLRDEWFAKVEAMELEPDDPRVPPAMRTGAWWRAGGQ